ncbi:uncharacterized protein LOC131249308 [Magnolia sinica]|uniref:uncharacterized protein LOC131249308 n=1 Tax=Magnolia sinica TaxID=86752 RepID=UPI0026596E8F|nr:uncharacterized protein LOC131249308 [Magnolia sinica]
MGTALIELDVVLRSTKEKLTLEEENILRTCKEKSIRAFTFGACLASGVVWTATRRLSYGYRLNLSGGAAVMSGMWSCDRAMNSCLNHIMALEGSRMQTVLTFLLLTRHQDNPRKLQLVKNHFYCEKVYDDSTLDQPKPRWRYRNFYGDNVGDNVGQQTHEDNHIHKPDLEPEQLTRTSANDVIVDPLDCILGYAKPGDEIHHADSTGNSLRRKHARGHKKAHRRHRTHHSENP